MTADQAPAGAAAPDAAGAAAASAPAIVVHGDPTPEQLAALVAVLSAASGGDEPASDTTGSVWAAHTAAMRRPVQHGPGAWRTSVRG